MRPQALIALAVLLAGGCASWHRLRPGPTPEGQAVRVSSHEPEAARREAIESLMPLFLTDEERSSAQERLQRVIFSRTRDFVGRKRLPKHGVRAVEVLLDKLSAALQASGIARPPGYVSGQEKVLIALGPPGVLPRLGEVVVGDALRLALFGRGIQARDLRDPFDESNKDAEHFRLLVETETVAAAARGGWDWVVAGDISSGVGREPQSRTFRAAARLDGRFYELRFSSAPAAFESSASAVDVSTTASLTRALEQTGQAAAAQVQARIEKRRAGRTTVACLLPGAKDLGRVRALLSTLRGMPEVEGAVLYAWDGPFDSMSVWVFVHDLTPEGLVARLLHVDHELRVTGIDSEEREIFFEAPMEGME